MCCISENTYRNLIGVYLDFAWMCFICKLYDAYMSGLVAADTGGWIAHVLPEIRTMASLRRAAAMLDLKPDT